MIICSICGQDISFRNRSRASWNMDDKGRAETGVNGDLVSGKRAFFQAATTKLMMTAIVGR